MAVYVMLSLVLGLTAAACVITSPTTTRAQERASRRRCRYVARYPDQANSADIRALLMRDGVSRDQAHFVTDLAADHGIKPTTMWQWIQRFDASSLAVVVAAEVASADLVRHLDERTTPDVAELEVFAALNGLRVDGEDASQTDEEIDEPVRYRRVLTATELDDAEDALWLDGDLHVPAAWTVELRASERRRGEGRDGLAA